MPSTLKIAIPMAGLGTRMRPHTWSKPKPLVGLAGKTVLDYVLEQFKSLPDGLDIEYIFIVGPQGDLIKAYMDDHYADVKVQYVMQAEMRGQSDALYLAREYLKGPMLMAFSDTLIETDLSFLATETCDGVACVKPVEDPRRFGVASVDQNGWITRLVEKPQDLSNNLAVVGFYYFRSAEDLISAIEGQMQRNLTLKNEFFLADAVNVMLERGAKFRTQRVETWLDAGTPESLLDTNRYLMENGYQNSEEAALKYPQSRIIPPVYIHDGCVIENSVIGPFVSIECGCNLSEVVVSNAIIGEESQIRRMIFNDSLIGHHVVLEGQTLRLSLGDNSWTK
jgi:glucose-1-phosphate thymidylyltransferase